MQEIKQQIVLTLAPTMKTNGYRKRNSTWHKKCQDTVLVFSTEKSRWGTNSFHFRLGIYLYTPSGELTPPYYRCPIQADLEQLVPDKFEFRRAADFDFPSSFTITERLAYITNGASFYEIFLPLGFKIWGKHTLDVPLSENLFLCQSRSNRKVGGDRKNKAYF